MDSNEKIFTLNALSKGLLYDYFCFHASSYDYTETEIDSPVGGNRSTIISEEGEANATCTVNMVNNTLLIFIEGLLLKEKGEEYWNTEFKSKIYSPFLGLSGEESDDYQYLRIPFEDMAKNRRDHYSVQFTFKKGKLWSVDFLVSKVDDNLLIYESELSLYGEIIE